MNGVDFIKRVKRAGPQTFQSLSESVNKIGDSLNGDRATELATAASFVLLKDPGKCPQRDDRTCVITDSGSPFQMEETENS